MVPSKKVLGFFFSFIMLMCSLSTVSASALNEENRVYYDDETGQKITGIYETTENGLRELSFEEFKKIREDSKKANGSLSTESKSPTGTENFKPATEIAHYYVKEYDGTWVEPSYPISNTMFCSGPVGGPNCSISNTYSISKSESFSANVTSDWKIKIKAAASFTWNKTATTTTTYTFGIPAGGSGRVYFLPYFDHTHGTMTYYIDGVFAGSTPVDGYSPQKLSNGELHGIIFSEVH